MKISLTSSMMAAAVGMAISAPEHTEQAAAGDHRDDGDGAGHRDGLLHDARGDEVGLELQVGEVADGIDHGRLPACGERDQRDDDAGNQAAHQRNERQQGHHEGQQRRRTGRR